MGLLAFSGYKLLWGGLFFWLIQSLVGSAWGQPHGKPAANLLTLEQALDSALRDNRLVKNAVLEVGKLEDLTSAARTRRLPNFNLTFLSSLQISELDPNFQGAVLGAIPVFLPSLPRDYTARTIRRPEYFTVGQLTQPIFQQYKISLNISLHQIMRDMAQEKVRAQRQSTVNEVKKTYYGIIQTQSSLDTVAASIKFLQELDRLTDRYVKTQVALKSENMEVKAKLARAEHDAATLQNRLASQKELLNDLMGREILTPFRVNPVPETTPGENDLEGARTRAVNQRPETRESKLKIKQAEYDRRLKQAEYIPTLDFTLSYINTANVELLPRNIGFAGLMLTWEPFDWGRKRKELGEKSRAVVQAKNLSQEADSQVLLEVNKAFRKLRETRSAIRASQMDQEAGREKLREMLDKYKTGTVLLKDVLQAQSSLSEADKQYQDAILSFWTAKAEFEKAVGEEK